MGPDGVAGGSQHQFQGGRAGAEYDHAGSRGGDIDQSAHGADSRQSDRRGASGTGETDRSGYSRGGGARVADRVHSQSGESCYGRESGEGGAERGGDDAGGGDARSLSRDVGGGAGVSVWRWLYRTGEA